MINKCEKCDLPFHSTCFPAKQVDGQRTCYGCAPVPLLAPPDQQCGGNFLHCKAFIGDRIEAAFLKVHGAAKGPSAIKRLGEYTGSRGYHKWKCSSGCYHGNLKTRVFTMGAQQVARHMHDYVLPAFEKACVKKPFLPPEKVAESLCEDGLELVSVLYQTKVIEFDIGAARPEATTTTCSPGSSGDCGSGKYSTNRVSSRGARNARSKSRFQPDAALHMLDLSFWCY